MPNLIFQSRLRLLQMKKISKECHNQLADLLPPMPPIAELELEVFMEEGPVNNTIVVGAINSLGQTFIDATSEVPTKASAIG
jgi:hypothetical protein